MTKEYFWKFGAFYSPRSSLSGVSHKSLFERSSFLTCIDLQDADPSCPTTMYNFSPSWNGITDRTIAPLLFLPLLSPGGLPPLAPLAKILKREVKNQKDKGVSNHSRCTK